MHEPQLTKTRTKPSKMMKLSLLLTRTDVSNLSFRGWRELILLPGHFLKP